MHTVDDWTAKQAAKTSAARALAAANPHLICAIGGNSLTTAAKNIRIELARAFPGVKFSVKTRRFSMGNAIDVHWTDGPISAQVNPIIDQYSAGDFDGMTDSYDYRHNAWVDAFGDAKYVHATREHSDAAIAAAVRTVQAKYAGNLSSLGITSISVDDWRNNRLWNVDVCGGGRCSNSDLQSLISHEVYRRTWALDKTPQPAEMAA